MKLKAKIEVNGKEIEMDIEVSEEELAKLQKEESRKVTGYGYGHANDLHYCVDEYNNVMCNNQVHVMTDLHMACNLYHDKVIAENNARADLLIRRLRRFAAEHNQKKIDWHEPKTPKYIIQYHNETDSLYSADWYNTKVFGSIYFNTKETAHLAIDTFHDELIWYFTEYNK